MAITNITTGSTALAGIALGLALSGCGGGSGGSGNSEPGVGSPNTQSFGLLKPAESDAEMAASLRKGLAAQADANLAFDELEASPAPETGLDGDNFSTTNLQEAGVDESDRVKYDGEILYILDLNTDFAGIPEASEELGLSLDPGPTSATIRLLRTDTGTPGTEEVATIEFESGSYNGSLYLAPTTNGKQLISLEESNGFYHWGQFAMDYYWVEQDTRIRSWDVSDPENPAQAWTVELDGSLLSSRIVDNVLYLVTRYTPSVDGLQPYPATEEARAANQALLDATPVAQLLPDIAFNGGEPQELLASTDCYVPNDSYQELQAPPASGGIIAVTAIDLEAPGTPNAICLNGYASGFYMSRNSLYVTSYTPHGQTLIHKVSLGAGQPEYRGSGAVPGYLGTRNPGFLMSESGDDLRVASSTQDDFAFPLPIVPDDQAAPEQTIDDGVDLGRHFLTVLRENPDTMSLDAIGQIPNADRPRKIGKPGEDLYAARFLGDRAYLVTFEVIDPLYVVNLANPQDPSIAGELEIPGFSTLLQPLSEELLLGVGHEVTPGAGLMEGVKVALFNVGDIANPVELASEVIGKRGSYSPALDNHHTLTLLQTDGIFRLALPITRHDEGEAELDPWTFYDWSDDGLYQFEADPSSGSLALRGVLISEQRTDEQPWPSIGLHNSRSVIHDDAVFFITERDVLSGKWGE
jgi:uncharacterized secreted protein with C-terminal beta-propeller domain